MLLIPLNGLTDDGFQQCVSQLKQQASAAGISQYAVNTLNTATFLPEVIQQDRYQPEFQKTFADYLSMAVSDTRIAQGKERLKAYAPLLTQLQKKYGIPPHILVAFWGLESNYGHHFGHYNIIDALTTLACDTRRPAFFNKELIATLKLIDIYGFKREKLVGSWAGAIGHTQFMPTNYLKYAIADNGHLTPDLWDNPRDALTSAAYFLHELGWQEGWKWGREVLVPKNFNYQESGLSVSHSISQWRKQGIKTVFNDTVPDDTDRAYLILPGGYENPAFLVYENFNVILKWNRSTLYAIAVGYLADRLNNSRPLHTALKTEPALSKATIKTLQGKLSEKGFLKGNIDGLKGPATQRAIAAYQQSRKMVADGHPRLTVLQSLGIKAPAVIN